MDFIKKVGTLFNHRKEKQTVASEISVMTVKEVTYEVDITDEFEEYTSFVLRYQHKRKIENCIFSVNFRKNSTESEHEKSRIAGFIQDSVNKSKSLPIIAVSLKDFYNKDMVFKSVPEENKCYFYVGTDFWLPPNYQ